MCCFICFLAKLCNRDEAGQRKETIRSRLRACMAHMAPTAQTVLTACNPRKEQLSTPLCLDISLMARPPSSSSSTMAAWATREDPPIHAINHTDGRGRRHPLQTYCTSYNCTDAPHMHKPFNFRALHTCLCGTLIEAVSALTATELLTGRPHALPTLLRSCICICLALLPRHWGLVPMVTLPLFSPSPTRVWHASRHVAGFCAMHGKQAHVRLSCRSWAATLFHTWQSSAFVC